MANTLKAVTVIYIGLYFILIEASPTKNLKKIADPFHCDRTLEDQNLPHASDCAKYYRCVYGKKVPKICPEKMLFNAGIGNCDLYYNVDCPFKNTDDDMHSGQDLAEAIEHLTRKNFFKKTDTVDVDDRTTVDGANTVSYTRPISDIATKFVFIPHEYDQTAYYKIENGERNLLYCEEGMIFSIDLEICARPWDFE